MWNTIRRKVLTPKIKVVQPGQSIQSVIDSISDASTDNPYVVIVPPGHEEGYIIFKPYIYIIPINFTEDFKYRPQLRLGDRTSGSIVESSTLVPGSRILGPVFHIAEKTVTETSETTLHEFRLPYIPAPPNALLVFFAFVRLVFDTANKIHLKFYLNDEEILHMDRFHQEGEIESIYGERYLNSIKGTTSDEQADISYRGVLVRVTAYVEAGQVTINKHSTYGLLYEFI